MWHTYGIQISAILCHNRVTGVPAYYLGYLSLYEIPLFRLLSYKQEIAKKEVLRLK